MSKIYIISTPIGNLEDITIRALRILKEVDIIICEDSRVTAKLLERYNIKKPLIIYNDQSKESDRERIISSIKENNRSAAIVSDAGTPLISDPGYKLLISAFESGVNVTAAPGPSSIITALSLSRLPSDKFFFGGYLPSKTNARVKFLQEYINYSGTLIFLESPRRLIDSMQDMIQVFGNRKACVARELTKLYEEVIVDNFENLIEKFKSSTKGEIVLLVNGKQNDDNEISEQEIKNELFILLNKYSTKDASLIMSNKYNKPKKYFYDLAKN